MGTIVSIIILVILWVFCICVGVAIVFEADTKPFELAAKILHILLIIWIVFFTSMVTFGIIYVITKGV